jgi:hypothetical protein
MFVSRAATACTRSRPASRTRFFHASPQAAAKLNVEGLAEKVKLEGQNVLVRVDLNVPLDKVSYEIRILMKYYKHCAWHIAEAFIYLI